MTDPFVDWNAEPDDTDVDQIADALLAFWPLNQDIAPHGVNADGEMDNPEC